MGEGLNCATCLQTHTVTTIERSIADESSKTPKATDPARISSICGRSSPTSLEVGRAGELDRMGSTVARSIAMVDTLCEGSRSIVSLCLLVVVMLGAIS